MSRTVLSVSQQSAAQITRDLILERAGYRVLSAGDGREALKLLKNSDHDVQAVVLGDSITPEMRREFGKACKDMKPPVALVMVCRASDPRELREMADEHVDALDDPELLLEGLDRALQRRSQ